MDSLRKSFQSHSSYKQPTRKLSQEREPILLRQEDDVNESMETGNHRNLPENSNTGNGKNATPEKEDQDFNFRRSMDDPPSKLIHQFLHKQRASGEISLDMDLEMEELSFSPATHHHLSSVNESQQALSKELRVSFQETVVSGTHQRSPGLESGSFDYGNGNGVHGSGEVLKCAGSIPVGSGLLRTRTKSRLMDPPPSVLQQQNRKGEGERERESERKSGNIFRSTQMKSAFLGKVIREEDEDPFLDEDIPNEFTREDLGILTLLQWVSLFVILVSLVCSLTIPVLSKQTVWQLHLWKWLVFVLVLICGRLVSGWGIRVVVFFIERNFLLRKKVLYFVYGLRKAVQNCLWLGLVLIAWHYLFDKKVERETNSKVLLIVSKVLVCLLIGTLIWLVKTLLVKVLASSFHVNTYFDRIQDSLFNQYVIETLSGPPLIEMQKLQEEEENVMAEVKKFQDAGANIPNDLRAAARSAGKSGKLSGMQRSPRIGKSYRSSGGQSGRKDRSKQLDDGGITIDHLHKLNQKNVSAWNMKRLMNIVRHGSLSTLDETIGAADQEDESATHIKSEYEAKAAAKKIFMNVAKPGCKCIHLDDLKRFMTEVEALKTMSLFEGAKEANRITKVCLKNWVVNAFIERRALSLTLNDTKTAVNKLHQMVNAAVGIVIVVIWLLVLGIATTHLLVFVGSQLLLVVFMFGNTCKMVFEAIIFLFVMHPFDVGDRCEIEGVQMIVEEMNILTTVFLRYDNQKIVYPNSVLSIKPISNYYRSPDMGDAVEFCIHIATPVEKVAIMKERIKCFIENKSDHWYPNPTVVVQDVVDMNKMKMAVWLRHRMNHQDMGERWKRRALVVEEMIKVFRELDIQYRMLPLDINLRNLPALSSTRLPSTWE